MESVSYQDLIDMTRNLKTTSKLVFSASPKVRKFCENHNTTPQKIIDEMYGEGYCNVVNEGLE